MGLAAILVIVFGLLGGPTLCSICKYIYEQFTYEPHPFEMAEIRYSKDGKHIFYIEEWSTGVDSWTFKLFYAKPDKKNTKIVYESDWSLENLQISSTGEYIIFQGNKRSKLVILNSKTFKKIKEIDFSDTFSLNYGWSPIGDKIYYTDRDGVYLLDLQTSKKKRLLKGDYYSLSWSTDGKLLVYTTGEDRFNGNSLLLYDIQQHVSKKLLKESSGEFEHAIIDNINKKVYFALTAKSDDSAEIGSIDLNTLQKNTFWTQKKDFPETLVSVGGFYLGADAESLIFNTIGNRDEGIYLLRLKDRKLQKVLTIGDQPWDYSPKTNKIIWYDSNTKTFKEKEVKF